MPIYDYKCEGPNCGHDFSSNSSKAMSEAEELAAGVTPKCPLCGAQAKRGIPRATSFQLKGSGWAHDNYGAKRRR